MISTLSFYSSVEAWDYYEQMLWATIRDKGECSTTFSSPPQVFTSVYSTKMFCFCFCYYFYVISLILENTERKRKQKHMFVTIIKM